MRKLTLICFVVLIGFVFFACDEHGGGGQGGGGGVSGVIGPDGGTIQSQDGRLTLTFPPGALSEDTKITITDIKPGELRAEVDGFDSQFTYRLEPDGIEFNVPVTASFLTDETPVQGDGSIVTEGALLVTSSNGQTELLENLTEDVNADEDTTSVSGELSHFSEFSQSFSGIYVTVSGVPDRLPEGAHLMPMFLWMYAQAKYSFWSNPFTRIVPCLRSLPSLKLGNFFLFLSLTQLRRSLNHLCPMNAQVLGTGYIKL